MCVAGFSEKFNSPEALFVNIFGARLFVPHSIRWVAFFVFYSCNDPALHVHAFVRIKPLTHEGLSLVVDHSFFTELPETELMRSVARKPAFLGALAALTAIRILSIKMRMFDLRRRD